MMVFASKCIEIYQNHVADVLGVVLRGREPLQEVPHLHPAGGEHVQGQEED